MLLIPLDYTVVNPAARGVVVYCFPVDLRDWLAGHACALVSSKALITTVDIAVSPRMPSYLIDQHVFCMPT